MDNTYAIILASKNNDADDAFTVDYPVRLFSIKKCIFQIAVIDYKSYC